MRQSGWSCPQPLIHRTATLLCFEPHHLPRVLLDDEEKLTRRLGGTQASGPIGFVEGFLPAGKAHSPFADGVPAVRSAAVQLLVSYMGATLGSLAAARAFVQQAADCYRCAVVLRLTGALEQAVTTTPHVLPGGLPKDAGETVL